MAGTWLSTQPSTRVRAYEKLEWILAPRSSAGISPHESSALLRRDCAGLHLLTCAFLDYVKIVVTRSRGTWIQNRRDFSRKILSSTFVESKSGDSRRTLAGLFFHQVRNAPERLARQPLYLHSSIPAASTRTEFRFKIHRAGKGVHGTIQLLSSDRAQHP